MKRLNRNMHGDDPAFHRLPEDPALAAQYLLLYELSLPFGSDLNNRIDVAKSATRMTVVIRALTSKAQRALDARAQAWLRANAPELANRGVGGQHRLRAPLPTQHREHAAGHDHSHGPDLAHPDLGLQERAPGPRQPRAQLSPRGHGLRPVGANLVGRVGLAGSVVTAMAFGIIVDDTIHFLSRYVRARREGLLPPEAVRAAFTTVGKALWTTTAILSLGFLVFASSGFELSWALGLLITITIVFALLADFLLLPPLLMAIDRRRS